MIRNARKGKNIDAHQAVDDIESQMIFKREQSGGASAGGLLIKDDGFEGFKSLKNDL